MALHLKSRHPFYGLEVMINLNFMQYNISVLVQKSVFLLSVFLTHHFTSITHSKETMSKFQLFKLSTMTFPFKILHVFLLAQKVINSCLADDGILFNQIWSSEININRWVH